MKENWTMSKLLRMMDPKNLHQKTIDSLAAVYELAESLGYSQEHAKALAIGALERKNQAGWGDYINKIRCIKQKTAKLGSHLGFTYDRIMDVRSPKKLLPRNPYLSLEIRILDPNKGFPPSLVKRALGEPV